MSFVLVRHRVEDFSRWKSVFDGADGARHHAGEKSFRIFHFDGDTNDVVCLFEWINLHKARDYFQSEQVRELMHKAGVIETPEVLFLRGVEQRAL